jgi:hypothetical protein
MNLLRNRTGVMYVYAVFIISLLVLAFFWFAFYSAMLPIQTAISATMTPYANNSTSLTFDLANTFVMNVWVYFLAIAVIALVYWGITYSQRRGQMYQ